MSSIDPSKNYLNPYQNGRVVEVLEDKYKTFPMFTDNNNKNNTFKNEALKGIQIESPLSNLFFSNVNMKQIQDEIRYNVWLRSDKKHVIDNQDTLELQLVMRAMYLQYSKNKDCEFREQVAELNKLVLEYCVPRILAEVEQYLGYLDDIQKQPEPIPLPENLSAKGTKSLRSITTTF